MENEKYYICESNGDLKGNIEELKQHGYKYIVKACDKFLSSWGGAKSTKHIQLIACKNSVERETIARDLNNDDAFNYVDWNRIENHKAIYNWARNKSYTIRNDWTRAFNR